MSIFTKILDKLGLRKDKSPESTQEAKPTGTSTTARPTGTTAAGKPAGTTPAGRPSTPAQRPAGSATSGPARPVAPANVPGPRPVSEVDVVKQLEEKARGSGLNWKVSIVDLLKLLDIDSSREARNELAEELGAPADVMSDSARMNVWLHKEVLKRIAQNGGNIPQNLLD